MLALPVYLLALTLVAANNHAQISMTTSQTNNPTLVFSSGQQSFRVSVEGIVELAAPSTYKHPLDVPKPTAALLESHQVLQPLLYLEKNATTTLDECNSYCLSLPSCCTTTHAATGTGPCSMYTKCGTWEGLLENQIPTVLDFLNDRINNKRALPHGLTSGDGYNMNELITKPDLITEDMILSRINHTSLKWLEAEDFTVPDEYYQDFQQLFGGDSFINADMSLQAKGTLYTASIKHKLADGSTEFAKLTTMRFYTPSPFLDILIANVLGFQYHLTGYTPSSGSHGFALELNVENLDHPKGLGLSGGFNRAELVASERGILGLWHLLVEPTNTRGVPSNMLAFWQVTRIGYNPKGKIYLWFDQELIPVDLVFTNYLQPVGETLPTETKWPYSTAPMSFAPWVRRGL